MIEKAKMNYHILRCCGMSLIVVAHKFGFAITAGNVFPPFIQVALARTVASRQNLKPATRTHACHSSTSIFAMKVRFKLY